MRMVQFSLTVSELNRNLRMSYINLSSSALLLVWNVLEDVITELLFQLGSWLAALVSTSQIQPFRLLSLTQDAR